MSRKLGIPKFGTAWRPPCAPSTNPTDWRPDATLTPASVGACDSRIALYGTHGIHCRASSVPGSVPSGVGAIADAAPVASVVDPDAASLIEVGDTLRPLVKASDDFAVKTVKLLVNGETVETLSEAPYRLSWEVPTEVEGTSLAVSAVVTDALGRVTTTAAVELPVESLPSVELSDLVAPLGAATAEITATVNKAGTLELTGDDVEGTSVVADAAGEVVVPVALMADALAELNKTGTFSAAITVTFTDALGKVAAVEAQVTYANPSDRCRWCGDQRGEDGIDLRGRHRKRRWLRGGCWCGAGGFDCRCCRGRHCDGAAQADLGSGQGAGIEGVVQDDRDLHLHEW